MMDNIENIRSYYDQPGCSEDSRLARHQLERDITMRYLEAYLPATGRILEIGAATGGYTAWLAEQGYQVTAVNLSESLIKQCRKCPSELGLLIDVTCLVADARDLSSVHGTEFDAI